MPEHMWKLLQEVEMFVFDGQEIFSHSVCDQCGKIFEKKSEVGRHVKGVHNRKFKCQVKGCAKSFLAKSGLESHSKDHNRMNFQSLGSKLGQNPYSFKSPQTPQYLLSKSSSL